MRHLQKKPHLNRTRAHRKALFSNLSAALFLNRRIITTLGKARYARRHAERMITFARKGDVASRRHVLRFVRNKDAVKILFDDLGPHFKNRNGGYTRIIKLGPRRGDAAPMALIELVGFDDIEAVEKKTETKSRMQASQKKVVDEKLKEDGVTEEVKVETAEAEEVKAEETPAVEEKAVEAPKEEAKSEPAKEAAPAEEVKEEPKAEEKKEEAPEAPKEEKKEEK